MSEEIQVFMVPKLTRGSVLRFSPYAWAKILAMRDFGNTEIGGYGITETDDPLLVTDFRLIKQQCTSVTIEFDKDDGLKFVEDMTDKGLSAWQFQSVFLHTHPGNCPNPSVTDEENFQKNFSLPHMAVFFILAKLGATYCRLRYNVSAGTEVIITSEIDYKIAFPPSDHDAWKKEYEEKVSEVKYTYPMLGDAGTNYRELMNKLHGEGNFAFQDFERKTIQELCDEKDEMDENLEMFWDHNEDCVWFWNEEEEDHWKYSPVERAFFDSDDSRISVKNIPKECKIADVIRFGVKCYKEQMEIEQPIEDSFLKEIEEIEPCEEMTNVQISC